jgi:hypothetical protein
MFNNQFLDRIGNYFPNFRIRYKNQSVLMKIIATLFFLKSFMRDYTTTIGHAIYFPDAAFVKKKPVTSNIFVLHELVHMHDRKKWNNILFDFLYLFPQILVLPMLLFLFIISWKMVLLTIFILMLPLPAYFRMLYEKRAYLASLYCMGVLNKKYKYNIDLSVRANFFADQFHSSYYYYMWPFKNVGQEFDDAVIKINEGVRPYHDEILFNMLDDVLSTL